MSTAHSHYCERCASVHESIDCPPVAQHTPGPARYWVVAKDHPRKLEGALLGYVVRESGGWRLSRPWLKEQCGSVHPAPEDAVRHLKHVQLEAEDTPPTLSSDQLRRIRDCLEHGVASGLITKSEAYVCAAIAKAAGSALLGGLSKSDGISVSSGTDVDQRIPVAAPRAQEETAIAVDLGLDCPEHDLKAAAPALPHGCSPIAGGNVSAAFGKAALGASE